jgi:hypothetical protein
MQKNTKNAKFTLKNAKFSAFFAKRFGCERYEGSKKRPNSENSTLFSNFFRRPIRVADRIEEKNAKVADVFLEKFRSLRLPAGGP